MPKAFPAEFRADVVAMARKLLEIEAELGWGDRPSEPTATS